MNTVEAKRGFLTFSFLCFASFSIYFFSKKIVELKFAKTGEDVSISVIDEATVTSTTAVISWNTSKEIVGSVVYGTDPLVCTQQETGSCLTATEESATTSHTITLTNLIPSTSYYFYLDNDTKKIDSFITKEQEMATPPVINTIEGDTNGDGQINSLDFSVN